MVLSFTLGFRSSRVLASTPDAKMTDSLNKPLATTGGATNGTDELANESSAGAGIAQFRTLGTMLAAAATFTV